MNVVIRLATAADHEGMIVLYRAALSRLHGLAPETIVREEFFRGTAGEEMLIAVDAQQRVLGMLTYYVPECFIHHLYIDLDAQRRGLGRRLLHALDARLPRPWQLKCLANNHQALQFYENLGWQKISQGVSTHGGFYLLKLE